MSDENTITRVFGDHKPKRTPAPNTTDSQRCDVTIRYHYSDGSGEIVEMEDQSTIKLICIVRDIVKTDKYLVGARLDLTWDGIHQVISIERDA